jgi:hypothetical protein
MGTSSISGWMEGVLFSLLFLALLTVVITSMNIDYNKNYDIGLDDNDTQSYFIEYSNRSQGLIETGEVTQGADSGITLKSSYGIIKDSVSLLWDFISLGFLENLINKLNLGEAGTLLAVTLRVLFVLSLIFAIIYALFKVVV